jgi:hypothetical protein
VQSPHRGPGWPSAGGWLRRSPRENCTSLSGKQRAFTPHGGSATSITWRAGKPGAARLGDPSQKYSSMRRATGETRRCSKGTKKKTALGEVVSPKGREFGDILKAAIPAPPVLPQGISDQPKRRLSRRQDRCQCIPLSYGGRGVAAGRLAHGVSGGTVPHSSRIPSEGGRSRAAGWPGRLHQRPRSRSAIRSSWRTGFP